MFYPPPVRPTFELPLTEPVDRAVDQLAAALQRDAADHPVEVLGQHVVLTIPPGDRHFWSPWLTMEAAPAGTGSTLHGRFSPKPAVWTGFMFAYITLTTAGCFGLMFAASLAIIGRPAWLAMLLGVLALLAAFGMYIAAQIGQGLAREQMDQLHTLVHDAIDEIRHRPPESDHAPVRPPVR